MEPPQGKNQMHVNAKSPGRRRLASRTSLDNENPHAGRTWKAAGASNNQAVVPRAIIQRLQAIDFGTVGSGRRA